jgi:periplasmic divalent cation tolerance protein
MPDLFQVTTAVDSREEGSRLARVLVERRLAACVQVVGPVESTYWWKGAIETASEWLCVAKTTGEQVDALVAALAAEHSYDVPEIVAVAAARVNDPYLRWVQDEVGERS